jgi:hypothetical protein
MGLPGLLSLPLVLSVSGNSPPLFLLFNYDILVFVAILQSGLLPCLFTGK